MTTLPVDTFTKICKNLSTMKLCSEKEKEMWTTLNQQRKGGTFCDATIRCGELSMFAHRGYLASISTYFKILFSSSQNTSQHVTTLKLFSERTVGIMLDILYRSVDIDSIDIVEMLRLAEFIRSDWLIDILVTAIRREITKETVHTFKKKEYGNTKSIFDFQNDVIVLSDSNLGRDSAIHIEKYLYWSQEFELIDYIVLQEIIPEEVYQPDTNLQDVAYDGYRYLYFYFMNVDRLIFKYDLQERGFLANFIIFDHGINLGHRTCFLDCKHVGKLFFCKRDLVYNLDDFDFENWGNHGIDKLRIVSPHIPNVKTKKKIKCGDVEALRVLNPTSFNGVVYDFVYSEDDTFFTVLVLDAADELKWTKWCTFPMYSAYIFSFKLMKKFYIMFEQCCSHIEKIDKIYNQDEDTMVIHPCSSKGENSIIFNFDPESKILKKCDIQLPEITWVPFGIVREHVFM